MFFQRDLNFNRLEIFLLGEYVKFLITALYTTLLLNWNLKCEYHHGVICVFFSERLLDLNSTLFRVVTQWHELANKIAS